MSDESKEWVGRGKKCRKFLGYIFSVSVPFNLELGVNIHSCLSCYQDLVTESRIFKSPLENGIVA